MTTLFGGIEPAIWVNQKADLGIEGEIGIQEGSDTNYASYSFLTEFEPATATVLYGTKLGYGFLFPSFLQGKSGESILQPFATVGIETAYPTKVHSPFIGGGIETIFGNFSLMFGVRRFLNAERDGHAYEYGFGVSFSIPLKNQV